MLRHGQPLVALPPAGAVLLQTDAVPNADGATIAGFRRFCDIWLRIDIAERIARTGHEAIAASRPYDAADPHIVSIGLPADAFADLMRQAGFRPVEAPVEGAANWTFRGRPKARPPRRTRPDGARSSSERSQGARPSSERRNDPRSAPTGEGSPAARRPPRGDGQKPDHGDRRDGTGGQDRRDGRDPRPPRNAPAGAATAKAFAGLADLLKRDG
jgi:ATP-dependent RNA helicase SUPV3L1/SUV3